jgi:hypothetical protein
MRRTLAGVAIATAFAGTIVTAGQAYAAAPGWKVAQTNGLPGEDGIKDITVAPTGSSWAGGYRTVSGKEVPLVQHLTSKGWTTVASPGSALGPVGAVTASSSKNVWAFGGLGATSHAARWNGSRWTTTSLPANFPVTDAAAFGAGDVWAVSGESGSTVRYAEHWTGKSWKKVALPAVANALSAVSSKDVWAVGTHKGQPAVMHWNGSSWKLAKTPAFTLPDPDTGYGVLHDVLALSAQNIWAVGGIEWSCGEDGDDTCSKPLILHWNGRAWSSTLLAQGQASFAKVAPDGAKGLWLLRGAWNPALVHLVGGKLTTAPAPLPAGHDVNITALATHEKTVWAGGVAFPTGDPDDPTGNGVYLRTG